MLGDRLYTDIALGRRFGITACLVLTGETTREQAEACPPEEQPDFIFPSTGEILELMFGQRAEDDV